MQGNRIFNIYGEGWPEFPRRAFARLDQTEPPDVRESEEAVFVFDSVDADWSGFAPGGDFDLTQPEKTRKRLAGFWKAIFGPPSLPRPVNPFDPMPIYRIEITARRADRFWDTLTNFSEEQWVTLVLDNTGSFPVDVYGGIFAAAVEASLASAARSSPAESAALDAQFDIDLWPNATDEQIDKALSAIGDPESLVAYDVGQGTALGVLDRYESVQLFFDLGAGAYGNIKTRPAQLRFCWRAKPPVILSHWDTDHWAGEGRDPRAVKATWVAPRQSNLGPTHHAFAGKIATSGKLLIWAAPAGTVRHCAFGARHTLTLARCTGRSRNGSGIAALVQTEDGEAWLLTGDAGYHELGLTLPAQLRTVVVPHHGADMGSNSIPPPRPNGYTRLVYSFGPDNSHGRTKIKHPTSAAVRDHIGSGWQHGTWNTATPAHSVAGADVLATAENGHGQTVGHLESTASGWMAAPKLPYFSIPCRTSTTGCTNKIVQS